GSRARCRAGGWARSRRQGARLLPCVEGRRDDGRAARARSIADRRDLGARVRAAITRAIVSTVVTTVVAWSVPGASAGATVATAGGPPRQRDALATAKIDANTAAIEDLTGKVNINETKLTKLAKQFQGELDALNRQQSKPGAKAAFERTGSKCGAFPSSTVHC